jgi:hypothetical protein
MLTARFDIDAAHRTGAIEALTQRVLPPLTFRPGIAGVHLCLADEAISSVETAEKKARADVTLVATWIVLLEGNSAADVRGAFEALAPALGTQHASAPDTAIYGHEFTRLKTPWSAG